MYKSFLSLLVLFFRISATLQVIFHLYVTDSKETILQHIVWNDIARIAQVFPPTWPDNNGFFQFLNPSWLGINKEKKSLEQK